MFVFATPFAFKIDLLPSSHLPQPATPPVFTTHPSILCTTPHGDNDKCPCRPGAAFGAWHDVISLGPHLNTRRGESCQSAAEGQTQ